MASYCITLSALSRAISRGQTDVVRLLLKDKRMDAKRCLGDSTALSMAILWGQIGVVKALLDFDKSLNIKFTGDYAQELLSLSITTESIESGQIDVRIVQMLLRNGVDPQGDMHLLTLASEQRLSSIISELLAHNFYDTNLCLARSRLPLWPRLAGTTHGEIRR